MSKPNQPQFFKELPVNPSVAGSGSDPARLTPTQAIRHAGTAYNSGQWANAEQLCRMILRVQADFYDALNLLGIIAAQTRRIAEAADLLGRAALAQPDNADAHNNYGNILKDLGRHEAALESYERALRIRPDFAEAHCNRSVVLLELKRLDAALLSCDRAIAIKPNLAEAHCSRGAVLMELNQSDAALASYNQAVAIRPNYADAYFNRGNALKELGRSAAALASYDQAIAIDPRHAKAYSNRGVVLNELKRWEAALASYDEAIAINPDSTETYSNRGLVLKELRRLELALASCNEAIRLNPEYAEAYSNRGLVLRELNQPEAALASCEQAIVIKPDLAAAYSNRGLVLNELNQLNAALASFDRATALKPDFADAHWNRSHTLLLGGDYERGWLEYEWRWSNEHSPLIKYKRGFPQPLWLGAEPLSGKTILLHSEQGLGDTLQFCRYAKRVAECGAKVILEVQRPLVSLLASLEGVAQIAARGDALPDFDYQCPLLSLPLAFKTTLSSIPAPVRYLKSNSEKVLEWQERLGAKEKLRVGLVWSGGFRPDQPELWSINNRRDIPLAKLAPLKHPTIEFYSLQKGQPAESELADLIAKGWDGPQLRDYTQQLQDFSDTAALIEQLDLVISVDTATAHLAGALGKAVWLLNRFDTCWRWLLARSDSPWYPTLRLYRQQTAGDWDQVVQKVRRDLIS
jgi:tetratricopeptide (TPR) repeat protein